MKTLFYSISSLNPTQRTFLRLLIQWRHHPPNTLLCLSYGRWQSRDTTQTSVVANLAVTAFSTYSTAKVLAAFCQQWKPTESESEKTEKLPPYFYQCLLKPRATSRLVLLASNTHTRTHTEASVLSLYFFHEASEAQKSKLHLHFCFRLWGSFFFFLVCRVWTLNVHLVL